MMKKVIQVKAVVGINDQLFLYLRYGKIDKIYPLGLRLEASKQSLILGKCKYSKG